MIDGRLVLCCGEGYIALCHFRPTSGVVTPLNLQSPALAALIGVEQAMNLFGLSSFQPISGQSEPSLLLFCYKIYAITQQL
jgi:hypothetical protein